MTYVTDPAERERIIRGMVDRIVDHCDPEQVILFGSHARGTADEQSDVDLLVILREPPHNKRQATVDLYRTLTGSKLPKDIVVTDTREAERYRDVPGTILRPALRDGRTLYVRRGA